MSLWTLFDLKPCIEAMHTDKVVLFDLS